QFLAALLRRQRRRRCSKTGGSPISQWPGLSTFKTSGDGKLFAAIGAECVCFESVETRAALLTNPERGDDLSFPTDWTRVARASWHCCEPGQQPRLHQTSPAREKDKSHHQPEDRFENSHHREQRHPHKTNHDTYHQTPGFADEEPEQRSQDLPAVQ